MRKIVCSLATLISLTAGAAGPVLAMDNADTGAAAAPRSTQDPVWARWQGRLSLGTSPATNWQAGPDGNKIGGASLMGDYYFSRALAGTAGGFRATSGVIFGPRAALLSTGLPGLGAGNGFSVGSRSLALGAVPYGTDPGADTTTLPYLGFGYTGLSPRSGWSFSADLGLVAQSPSGLRTIRSQSLDDAVREMRLAPLVQLGATYAF